MNKTLHFDYVVEGRPDHAAYGIASDADEKEQVKLAIGLRENYEGQPIIVTKIWVETKTVKDLTGILRD